MASLGSNAFIVQKTLNIPLRYVYHLLNGDGSRLTENERRMREKIETMLVDRPKVLMLGRWTS